MAIYTAVDTNKTYVFLKSEVHLLALYVYGCLTCMCVGAPCMCSVLCADDPLEQKLQMLMSPKGVQERVF